MKIRPMMWTEASKTAVLLDGLMIEKIDGKVVSCYEHWYKKADHLCTWGEAER